VVRIDDIALYFLSIETEATLSFGGAHVDSITVVRVGISAHRRNGDGAATGWADIPLNMAWAWPDQPRARAEAVVRGMIADLRRRLIAATAPEDPFVAYHRLLRPLLEETLQEQTALEGAHPIPELVASLVLAPFDIAWHDLFGLLYARPSWDLYRPPWISGDLAGICSSNRGAAIPLRGVYPSDIINLTPRSPLLAWHLVGISDPVGEPENPRDLSHWIRRDGLRALKVKVHGADPSAAAERFASVADISRNTSVRTLSVDFNGTLPNASAYHAFIRSLHKRSAKNDAGPAMPTLVEQPFEAGQIPPVPAKDQGFRPIYALDESITTVESVLTAHAAGWDAIVVKTCKTQTTAILLAALARRLGMRVIVQDLTNPMLALLAHVQLAAHLDDGWGVEVNGVQYYPEASQPEAMVHPAAFARRDGYVSTESLGGPGIGYRIEEIQRQLPERAA